MSHFADMLEKMRDRPGPMTYFQNEGVVQGGSKSQMRRSGMASFPKANDRFYVPSMLLFYVNVYSYQRA